MVSGAEEEMVMIRRRINPTGVYAGLSSLVLIAALPGPADPQIKLTPVSSSDARPVPADSAGAAGDEVVTAAPLDSAAV